MNPSLPVLGSALRLAELPQHLEWLCASARDLELTDPLTNVFFEGFWRSAAKQAAALLADHGGRRGAHAPFSSTPVDAADRRVVEVLRDRLRESLEFVALTGGSHLVLHSPFLYFGRGGSLHRGEAWAEQALRVRDNLAPIVEEAAAQQCVLVIENIFDARTEPLDALVRSLASPWVRRSLDTGHANLMRDRGAPPPDVWIADAGEQLAHVHLADNDGESDRHWACGEGTINWTSTFQALARLLQPPRLILEMSPARQHASVAWLAQRGLAR